MAARLGDVVYWGCCLFAGLLVAVIAYGAAYGTGKGAPMLQFAGVGLAATVWLFGKGVRYVLRG